MGIEVPFFIPRKSHETIHRTKQCSISSKEAEETQQSRQGHSQEAGCMPWQAGQKGYGRTNIVVHMVYRGMHITAKKQSHQPMLKEAAILSCRVSYMVGSNLDLVGISGNLVRSLQNAETLIMSELAIKLVVFLEGVLLVLAQALLQDVDPEHALLACMLILLFLLPSHLVAVPLERGLQISCKKKFEDGYEKSRKWIESKLSKR